MLEEWVRGELQSIREKDKWQTKAALLQVFPSHSSQGKTLLKGNTYLRGRLEVPSVNPLQ